MPLQILDDMDYILETKCLAPEALQKAFRAVQMELPASGMKDGRDVFLFNQLLAVCVNGVGIHLRRELTVDEKIFVGHKVYTFLVSRGVA